MTTYGIEKILQICKQCLDCFESWKKKCSTLQDIVKQIDGLEKSQWNLFNMTVETQIEVQDGLQIRLMDQILALEEEIVKLGEFHEKLRICRDSLEGTFSKLLSNKEVPKYFGFLYELNGLCGFIQLMQLMKQYPLRMLKIENLESFQVLNETNRSTEEFEDDIEATVHKWSEIIMQS